MTVSNAQRAQLRRLIGAAAAWPEYRRANGLGDTSTLGSASCLAVCAALALDHSQITGSAPMTNIPAPAAPAGLFTRSAPAAVAASVAPAAIAPSVQAAMDALLGALAAQQGGSAAVAALAADLESVTARVQILESAAPALLVVDRSGEAWGDELPATRHPMLETLIRCATARDSRGVPQNVWISGPTGSGKTTGARMAAEALGLAWGFHSQMQMPHELIGFIDGHGKYHSTVFVDMFRADGAGGLCLLDEIDSWAPDATAALNSALANGKISLPTGEIVDRHADFHCVGAGNTWGLGPTAEFVGRQRLDAAFRSRFPIKLSWGYDQALERAIAQNDAWADRVFAARRAAEKHGVKTIIDPRVTIAGAALIRAGFSSDEAAGMTYLAELAPAQAALVEGK